jgi:DNA-binding MarR family transcriptional regulator
MTATQDHMRASTDAGAPAEPSAHPGTPAGSGAPDRPSAPSGAPEAGPELAARLRLVINRLARRLRGAAGEGLSPSLVSALVSIELCQPITLGKLAERELVKPPSVTRMVAYLEERGLVRRQADADDRRIARLSLTAEGRRMLRRTRSRKTAYLVKRLGKLDAAQLAVVQEALPILERLLEDES